MKNLLFYKLIGECQNEKIRHNILYKIYHIIIYQRPGTHVPFV
jgi:hypothetical protein